MIYYSDRQQDNIQKYRINIQKNNKNYTIALYVVQSKLHVSIKYKTDLSDEIFEYANFYSFHQLQIINKYFKYFDNLEQICRDLDKKLKTNKISIEEKSEFIIIKIKVLIKNEKTNIVLKLLKKKITDYHPQKSRKRYLNASNLYKDYTKNSLSMPKYNDNETKSLLNGLNDRISVLENSHRYDSLPKENINNQYLTNDINVNDNKIFLNNINTIIKRINKLEDLNQEKDYKIKELEDQISKFEGNISNIMSYPVYSIPNISQKSRNEKSNNNISYINKKKNNVRNPNELEIEINSGIFNDKNEQTLRNKKHSEESNKKKDIKYHFEEIEEKNQNDNIKPNKKDYLNKSLNEENNIKLNNQKKNIKNRNKSQQNKHKNNSNSPISMNEEEDSTNNNKKYHNHKINPDDNQNKENMEGSSYAEGGKKNNGEKNSKTVDNSISKKEILNKKMALSGLPMVEREDIKKYINSRIFYTRKEMQMVKNKIIKNKKHLHCYFDLLYRASIDGDYEEIIDSLCKGVYPQLILFYTQEGARFGIYIEKEKHTSFFGEVTYKEIPGTSFLFSLNSLKIYDVLEGRKASDDGPEKLCFGKSFYYNSNDSNWFIKTPKNQFLLIECMIGDKECSFGNIDTNEIVGMKKEYYLEDVEIFKVVIYPDGDDDESSKHEKEKEIKINNKNNSDNDTID